MFSQFAMGSIPENIAFKSPAAKCRQQEEDDDSTIVTKEQEERFKTTGLDDEEDDDESSWDSQLGDEDDMDCDETNSEVEKLRREIDELRNIVSGVYQSSSKDSESGQTKSTSATTTTPKKKKNNDGDVIKKNNDDGWVTERKEWCYDPHQQKYFRWLINNSNTWHRLYKGAQDSNNKSWILFQPIQQSQQHDEIVWRECPDFGWTTNSRRKWYDKWLRPDTAQCKACLRCVSWPQCDDWPCPHCEVCEHWPRCRKQAQQPSNDGPSVPPSAVSIVTKLNGSNNNNRPSPQPTSTQLLMSSVPTTRTPATTTATITMPPTRAPMTTTATIAPTFKPAQHQMQQQQHLQRPMAQQPSGTIFHSAAEFQNRMQMHQQNRATHHQPPVVPLTQINKQPGPSGPAPTVLSPAQIESWRGKPQMPTTKTTNNTNSNADREAQPHPKKNDEDALQEINRKLDKLLNIIVSGIKVAKQFYSAPEPETEYDDDNDIDQQETDD